MNIFLEFAIAKQQLLNKVNQTQHIRDEHLFKLLVYLPYRKENYNTWCNHLWKPFFRLPLIKGMNNKHIYKYIYSYMIGNWNDSFHSLVVAYKEAFESDGYPEVEINENKLLNCYLKFHEEYAKILANEKNNLTQ